MFRGPELPPLGARQSQRRPHEDRCSAVHYPLPGSSVGPRNADLPFFDEQMDGLKH